MTVGTYSNLMAQVEKLRRHAKQGSVQTRYRYYHAVDRFCRFVAEEYKLQKLANVKEKHIVAYAKRLQETGKSAGYVKTELSGIRYFCHELGVEVVTNEEIGALLGKKLERRRFGEVPRAWRDSEVENALKWARLEGKEDLVLIIKLARVLGLRIHETIRLRQGQVQQALAEGYLTIKGKGGLVREVPLTGKARTALKAALELAQQERLFVRSNEKAHQVQKRVENWIYNRRSEFTEGETKLTYHGLRHTYAQERYAYHLRRLDGNEKWARLAVAEELGHGRDAVTRIYLAGYKAKVADGATGRRVHLKRE